MSVREERRLCMRGHGFDDVNQALAWVIAHVDGELADASHVNVQIDKSQVRPTGEDDAPWQPDWSASVAGIIGRLAEGVPVG